MTVPNGMIVNIGGIEFRGGERLPGNVPESILTALFGTSPPGPPTVNPDDGANTDGSGSQGGGATTDGFYFNGARFFDGSRTF